MATQIKTVEIDLEPTIKYIENLLSKYEDVQTLVKEESIHESISEGVKFYSQVFDQNDTVNLADIILENSPGMLDLIGAIDLLDPKLRSLNTALRIVEPVAGFMSKLKLPIKTENDAIKTFKLRDKLYALLRLQLYDRISRLDIMPLLSGQERELYEKVYRDTVDFYLKKYFAILNDVLKSSLVEKKIPFKFEYLEMGYFYKPNS